VRCRYFIAVEVGSDAAEAVAGRVRVADALDDVPWHRGWASGRGRLPRCLCSPAALCDKALELIDRNQPRSPGHLDRLDVWQHAADERRTTDAERLGGLGARVRETLDVVRLADYLAWRAWELRRVATFLRASAPRSPAAAHPYTVHKP
jgi:hypothetical protein